MQILNKIKKLTNTEDKKRLLTNFLSLGSLQLFTYALPLITLPYLVRVLGVEKYGLVAFAQSFIMFFHIIVDYGFNLSATREIAVNRSDRDKITEIYSSVMIIKVLLLIICFFVLLVIVLIVDKFVIDSSLYLLTFLSVVAQALFPIWYFQGMERMKYITIINILSKVIFTAAIFIFVKQESDYLLVPVLSGVGACIGSFYALWIIKTSFSQKFKFQSYSHLRHSFIDSTQYFLSRVAVTIYTSANAFVLGIATNNTMVGYYSIAEKIYKAIQGLYGPITQSLYPYVAKERNIDLFKRILKLIIVLNLVGTVILYFAVDIIFVTLFGQGLGSESTEVFRILLVANLIVIPSILIGYPLLGALGHVRYANMSVIYASLFHFIGLAILLALHEISIYNVALMVVFTQIIDLIYRCYGVLKTRSL